MLNLQDIIAIDAHHLCQRQSRGKLGKLSRLQAQWSQYEPRPRALDTMRIEDGGKEQHQHDAEDNQGKHIVEPVVEHQDYETQNDRGSYPDNLHTRARIEAEDIRITIGIAGTTDTDPPEGDQRQVDDNGPPVE